MIKPQEKVIEGPRELKVPFSPWIQSNSIQISSIKIQKNRIILKTLK